MPKKTKKERAQEIFNSDDFLKGVLEKVPEDQRDAALEKLGDYMLKQDEFNRYMDEVREKESQTDAYKKELDDWYAANLRAIEKGAEILRAGSEEEEEVETPKPKPGAVQTPQVAMPDLKGYVKKEEVERILSQKQLEIEQRGAALVGFLTKLGNQHRRDFKEDLDPEALYAHAAKIRAANLQVAYDDMVKERAVQLAEERKAEERKQIEKEVREKLLKEHSSELPYSVPMSEPSALDGLRAKTKETPSFGVQAAVDEYYRGVAGRT